MAQALDELFLKLALRQGLLNQQEAVQFLNRYRSEGAPGEGIGQWLVNEGVIAEEQAAVIINAIAQRAEGHVADVRRRVPKAKSGGAGSGSRVAKAHQQHGHHGGHAAHRHAHAPAGKKVTPAQQVIYIGSGVATIGLIVFVILAYQRSGRQDEIPVTPPVAQEPVKPATAAEVAAKRMETADAAAPAPETVQWTDKEIESIRTNMNDAIRLALNHVGDGRPGKGIDTIRKRLAELGDRLPPAVQTVVDAEIANLQTMVDAAYEDALSDLRAAKAKSDAEKIEEIYAQLELSCGPSYVEKAKKALE